VPFRVRFWNPDDPPQATAGLPAHPRQDKQLAGTLLGELPGILNWCLQGCLNWQAQGFQAPDEVIAATEEFKAEQDELETFLTECCHKGGPELRVRASALHACYLEWCKRAGEKHPLTMRGFGTAIMAKGYEKKQNNGVWYVGVMLRTPEEDVFEPGTEGTEG
jgi:putative DNA primase/helicase